MPNFTFKNIYDYVNLTFNTIKQIYSYLLENQQFAYIFNKLLLYQPFLLEKTTTVS